MIRRSSKVGCIIVFKQNLMVAFLRQLLVVYGYYLPYYPGKWLLIKGLAKKISKVPNVRHTVIRRGIKYQLDITDPMDRIIYYTGVHEGLITKFLHGMVRPGFTCFDVGANLGYYTLFFSNLVGPHGEVHGFEPCPEEFSRLQKNLSLNNLPVARLHQIALSDSTGKIGITGKKRGGLTRIGSSVDEVVHEVQCSTLDEFMKSHRITRLDILKVDIDGAEVKFLRGGLATISQHMPIIIIELNPKALNVFGNNVFEINEMLSRVGYVFYKPHRRGLRSLHRMPTTGNHVDAVALPGKLYHLKDDFRWAESKALRTRNGN